MSLSSAKGLASALHRALVPHEETIYKLEDVLLFFHPAKAVILFLLVNLTFFGLYWLGLTAYSTIFLALAVYHLLPTVLSPLASILGPLVLPDHVSEVTGNSAISRYNIAQISAFVGTVYYVIEGAIASAGRCLRQKQILPMLVVLFALMFLFYLFLSFSDAFIVWFFINGVLLLPFLSQLRLSSAFDKIGEKVQDVAEQAAVPDTTSVPNPEQ